MKMAVTVSCLVMLGAISPAWASVSFDSYLPMDGTTTTPQFIFSKIVTIDYPEGGKLKDAFNGRTDNISFSDSSDNNPDIRSLMNQINSNLEAAKNSVRITNLNVDYLVSVTGSDRQVVFDYRIILTPTINGYMLHKGQGDAPTVFDVSWMGFAVRTPVMVATNQYGNLEINYPMGVIQNQFHVAYHILEGTAAQDALDLNLMDAGPLVAYPIDKWSTLFDPAFAKPSSPGIATSGDKVAVTAFAFGQSDEYQGSSKSEATSVDFTADSKYRLTVIEKASSGTIDVEGHANGYFISGSPAISSTVAHPGCVGCIAPEQALFRSVLGISVAVAAVIVFWVFYFRHFRDG